MEESEVKKNNLMWPVIIGGVVILALVAAVVANNGNRPQGEDTAPQQQATETTQPAENPVAENSVDQVRVIEVEAGSFYFKPDIIRVNQGERVRIVLNSVSMMHNFTVDELGIASAPTPSGESTAVEFTADTIGEFESYCGVGDHRSRGQVGKVIVE